MSSRATAVKLVLRFYGREMASRKATTIPALRCCGTQPNQSLDSRKSGSISGGRISSVLESFWPG
jgi:hypothetical protein